MPRKKSFASALSTALNPPPVDAFALLEYEPACLPRHEARKRGDAIIPEPCGQCPQEQFAEATEFSVLYGGASGGGKTLAALCWALRACAEHPGLRIGAFRRSYPELRESLLAELANLSFAEALGAVWHGTEHELSLPNRSAIVFRYAESVKDASRRQGGQYQAVVFDELTLFDPSVVTFLESRLRSGRSNVPVLGIRATSNPGGPGHADVRKRFVDATAYGTKVVTDERGRSVRFVAARAADNPHLNPEYTADLLRLPEAQRAAFLDGNWDMFAGMMFPELSRDRHVIRPMALPPEWRRVCGVDWGFAKPWAVIWLAIDEDDRIWCYREQYAVQVGEAEQARRILEAEADEHVMTRWADSAMWAVRGDAPPLSKVYEDAGCHIEPSAKGPGSRVAGWQRLRSYLAEAPACPHHRAAGAVSCPKLHIFSTCEDLWRELANLPHASIGDPEDADTRVDDHACDALRYAISGLGAGGPEFTVFSGDDDTVVPGQVNAFGIEVLRPLGPFAVRPYADDPWESGPGLWAEDDAPARIVRTVRDAGGEGGR